MHMEPRIGSWIVVKNEVFDDDQQVKKGAIGHFLGRDGWLWVIDILGRRLALKPWDVICLDGVC